MLQVFQRLIYLEKSIFIHLTVYFKHTKFLNILKEQK